MYIDGVVTKYYSTAVVAITLTLRNQPCLLTERV